MKITPVSTLGDDFDGVNEIYEDLKYGSKDKKKIKRKILPVLVEEDEKSQRRKKPTSRKNLFSAKQTDTQYSSKTSAIGQISYFHVMKVLLCGRNAWQEGVPFLLLASLCSALLESLGQVQHYNFVLVILIAVAMKYPHLPKGSVRTQLCISAAVLGSFALDIFLLYVHANYTGKATQIFCILLIVFKILYFYAFLYNIPQARRIRRYLDRRLRLFLPLCPCPSCLSPHSSRPPLPFCLPGLVHCLAHCSQPRRLMRDVRGRLLALGWIHLCLLLAYLSCLLTEIYYFNYPLSFNTDYSSQLTFFLVYKSILTGGVLGGLVYDSDLNLCFWEFGCLAFHTTCIRTYIKKIRLTRHGYPLAFSFSPTRFQLLCAGKVLDSVGGAYGWAVLGESLRGEGFFSLDEGLRGLLSVLFVAVFVDSLYSPLLFASVHYLARTQHLLVKHYPESVQSDDSELDDFHLRLTELDEEVRRRRREREREREKEVEEREGEREEEGEGERDVEEEERERLINEDTIEKEEDDIAKPHAYRASEKLLRKYRQGRERGREEREAREEREEREESRYDHDEEIGLDSEIMGIIEEDILQQEQDIEQYHPDPHYPARGDLVREMKREEKEEKRRERREGGKREEEKAESYTWDYRQRPYI